MNLQKLANETGQKIYLYRMNDYSTDHSTNYLCKGDHLNGKVVIELLGAYIPKKSTVG